MATRRRPAPEAPPAPAAPAEQSELYLMTVDKNLQPKPFALQELLDQVRSAAAEGAAAACQQAVKADPDEWMDSKAAARHIYGRDGQVNAFRQLRLRNPSLAELASGTRNQRRWRRRDLDAWMKGHEQQLRAARRRAEDATQKVEALAAIAAETPAPA